MSLVGTQESLKQCPIPWHSTYDVSPELRGEDSSSTDQPSKSIEQNPSFAEKESRYLEGDLAKRR